MDGGDHHPMIQGNRLETLQKLTDKGVGLVCLHYAVEVPNGTPARSFSNGSAATMKAATPSTRPGRRTFKTFRITRSRAGSNRSPSATNGISTSGSGPR